MKWYTTQSVRELDAGELRAVIEKKSIAFSPHALDYLSTAQRKVFKESELQELLRRGTPRKAYLQQNGRYAAYYRTNQGYRKIIIADEKDSITIITFMDVSEIPRVNLEHGSAEAS